MSALSWRQGRRSDAPAASAKRAGVADGFVLPRWLRRPARLLTRFSEDDVALPRHAAAVASGALIAAFGLYGAILGGHMPSVVSAVTARAGFAVDEVKISGHRETSEIDILERLGLDGWTSLVGLDADEARKAIAALPWVASAEVRKIYPDTIEVALVEREPFAIWQHGRELSIVEASGAVIARFAGERHATLPLVLGLGAPGEARAFIDKIAAYPELASRVKGYIRVGERRWDLRLENGIAIRLPEENEDAAIASLVRLDKEQGLLARDIAAIDMRIREKLVIRLTPEAALRRNAALEQRDKDARKSAREKRI